MSDTEVTYGDVAAAVLAQLQNTPELGEVTDVHEVVIIDTTALELAKFWSGVAGRLGPAKLETLAAGMRTALAASEASA